MLIDSPDRCRLVLRFKVDENLPTEVAELLTNAGHDAITVPEQRPGGYFSAFFRAAGCSA
jgi:hypothetical protein